MNYSNEFLERVFAAYWGVDCRYKNEFGTFEPKVDRQFFGNNKLGNDYKIQLLLTPLSQISDEDAIEVARILGLSYNNDPESECYYDLGGLIADLTSNSEDYIKMHFNGSGILIDHLRSRGYDCGYGEIPSLIEAGIAIEKPH